MNNPELPSQTTQYYWIYAQAPNYFQVNKKGNIGKWLIFVPLEDLDTKWSLIREATEKGKLGYSSKSSTAKFSQSPKVICVYTHDAEDVVTVWRVERQLRQLGIKEKLVYKTNEVTRLEAKGQQVEQRYKYISELPI